MTGAQTLSDTGNIVANKMLLLLSSFGYDGSVTEPISQILKAMKQRVEYEAKRLKAIENEMEELADKYNRYKELQDAESSKSRLLNKLEAILGKTPQLQYLKLWEVLELYLRFVSEAQVADILGFFECIGYKSNRQAIESTIKTHKRRFAVRKEGWDRFISLIRKERSAPSTNDKRR